MKSFYQGAALAIREHGWGKNSVEKVASPSRESFLFLLVQLVKAAQWSAG